MSFKSLIEAYLAACKGPIEPILMALAPHQWMEVLDLVFSRVETERLAASRRGWLLFQGVMLIPLADVGHGWLRCWYRKGGWKELPMWKFETDKHEKRNS